MIAMAIHHIHLNPNNPMRLLVLAPLILSPPSCTMTHYNLCPFSVFGMDTSPATPPSFQRSYSFPIIIGIHTLSQV